MAQRENSRCSRWPVRHCMHPTRTAQLHASLAETEVITRQEQATILEGSLKCNPNSQQLPPFIVQSGWPPLLCSALLLSSDTHLSIETRLPLIQRLKAFEGCDVKSGHQTSPSRFEQYKNNASVGHWITFNRKRRKKTLCCRWSAVI